MILASTLATAKTETRLAPLLRRQAQRGLVVADLCGAVLLRLAQHAPLVLAVHSGGKSLHGWFHCPGQPEETLLRFMRYAVSLGADPATWTRSQFVRMPDGRRDNGQRQTVYFLRTDLLPMSQTPADKSLGSAAVQHAQSTVSPTT